MPCPPSLLGRRLMRITLLAVGTRMPAWVEAGYQEYARRMPSHCRLHLVEVPAAPRSKGGSAERWRNDEGDRLLKAVPKGARLVVLDGGGKAHSTASLAAELEVQLASGRDLALLVGGPDGLSEACRQRAEGAWSLSPLTFPHPLVRVLLAEQLYRALSLVAHHPYHRE